jgi:transcriptional regulator with XRE-family HTH domain
MLIAMNKNKKAPESTLGSRLAGLLDDYGLSPETLASMVKMSGAGIRDIIKDKSNPYRGNLEKLAAKLGTTYDYLARGEGEKFPEGKKNLSVKSTSREPDGQDAWDLAREQIRKKDDLLEKLAVSFDRVTLMLQERGGFLQPVRETGT